MSQRNQRLDGSDRSEVRTAVEVSLHYYGLEFKVVHEGTTWNFLLDLYHLEAEDEDRGCVQIVAYNPQDPDGEPLQHLRVWPDGRFETFEG
ncbi:MAG: hypothetical protein KIT09_00400 [Bryobacteraceae bacterium]|nr:hypothetical protein [Bryobacteraceae bacterium]